MSFVTNALAYLRGNPSSYEPPSSERAFSGANLEGQSIVQSTEAQPLKAVIEDLTSRYGEAIAEAVRARSFPTITDETKISLDQIQSADSLAGQFKSSYKELQQAYGEAGQRAFKEVFGKGALDQAQASDKIAVLHTEAAQKADQFLVLDLVIFIISTLPPKEQRAFIQRLRDTQTTPTKENDPSGTIAFLRELVLQACDLLDAYYAQIERHLPDTVKDLRLHERLTEPTREALDPATLEIQIDKNSPTTAVNITSLSKEFNKAVAEYKELLKQKLACESLIKKAAPELEKLEPEEEEWTLINYKDVKNLLKETNIAIAAFFKKLPETISHSLVKTYTAYQMVAQEEIAASQLTPELCKDVHRLAKITLGGTETIDNDLARKARTVAMLTRDVAIEKGWIELEKSEDSEEEWVDINIEHKVLTASEELRFGDKTDIAALIQEKLATKQDRLEAIAFLKARRSQVLYESDEGVNAAAFDHASQELLRALEMEELKARAMSSVQNLKIPAHFRTEKLMTSISFPINQYVIGTPTKKEDGTTRYEGGHDDPQYAQEELAKLDTQIQDAEASKAVYEEENKSYQDRIKALTDPSVLSPAHVVNALLGPQSPESRQIAQNSLDAEIQKNKRFIFGCDEIIKEASRIRLVWKEIVEAFNPGTDIVARLKKEKETLHAYADSKTKRAAPQMGGEEVFPASQGDTSSIFSAEPASAPPQIPPITDAEKEISGKLNKVIEHLDNAIKSHIRGLGAGKEVQELANQATVALKEANKNKAIIDAALEFNDPELLRECAEKAAAARKTLESISQKIKALGQAATIIAAPPASVVIAEEPQPHEVHHRYDR